MIQTALNAMLTVLMAKFLLNDVPHAVGLTHNPGSSATDDIIMRGRLKEYESRFFPSTGKESVPKIVPFERTVNISTYAIVMTRKKGSCKIKLYENLEGWNRKLRATWSGLDVYECDRKFEELVDITKQVVAEHRAVVRRLRP